MKIAIILNGISRRKKFFYHNIFPRLNDVHDVTVFETASQHDPTHMAFRAVAAGFDLILAAGGDGTLFHVLNGILKHEQSKRPPLGVIPLGSGNDFARTLEISIRGDQIISMVNRFEVMPLDVGEIAYTTERGETDKRYFLNVADAGMGPEVVSRMMNSGRALGSAVAYYSSILATFFSYTPCHTKAIAHGWRWSNKMRTFAVANGKFYGHGLCIAPQAKLDDGMFEVFACADASVLDFILQSVPLKKKKRLNHEKVSYYQAQHISLSAEVPCKVEADGELLGFLPATISIAPQKIDFLVPSPGTNAS